VDLFTGLQNNNKTDDLITGTPVMEPPTTGGNAFGFISKP
jgi:hypothetical protein